MTTAIPTSEVPEALPRLTRWQRWALTLILLGGLTFRLGMAASGGLASGPVLGSDQEEYDTYAWNLAQGRGYRGMSPDVSDPDHLTAYRPPGTSLLWAGLFTVFGHRYDVVRIAHCLLGTMSIWLVSRIGRRELGNAVGLLAAAAYAVFPPAVVQSGELLSEPLGVFLFLLWMDGSLQMATGSGIAGVLVSGLCLGLALLTRSNLAVVLPLYVLWGAWQFRGRRQLARFALSVVLTALVMSPWIVRNYLVFGRFIPLSTTGGSALLQGNNRLVVSDPQLHGYMIWDTAIPEYRQALQSAGDEVTRDERAKQLALAWLRENPDLWPRLLWNKFVRSWTPVLTHHPSALHRWLHLLTWGPVLLLFAMGFFPTLLRSLQSGRPTWLIHLAIGHYVVNSLVFFAYLRYRAPVDPLCLILAAWTVVAIWTSVFPRAPARSSTGSRRSWRNASSKSAGRAREHHAVACERAARWLKSDVCLTPLIEVWRDERSTVL